MRLGMNVQVTGDGLSAMKFLGLCVKVNIPVVRLSLEGAALSTEMQAAMRAIDMKFYLLPLRMTPQIAAICLSDWDTWSAMIVTAYANLAFQTAGDDVFKSDVLAIALPEDLHLITRSTNRAGAVGLRREQVRSFMAQLAKVIRAEGHKVALPLRLDDAQGKVYDGLDFDVFDLDCMLSAQSEETMSQTVVEAALDGSPKPYWYGRAGMLGGYIVPAQQLRFLRKLETLARGAEYAFLWSEEASPKWSWSQSGATVLDALPQGLRTQGVLVPTGDPAVAHWKAEQRRGK